MGGLESEITAETRDILLEAAAWNFINIRRTANQHGLPSEASYRYSRGMHPALALNGLKRCLQLMSLWSGGTAAPGIVDNYPLPPRDPQVIITPREIRRALGIDIPLEQVKTMLERLEFSGRIADGELRLQTPPIRLDIGEDLVGVADVMEEIARLYGYDNIPETRMSDELPPQHGHPLREQEERVRDILAEMGLQEVITHRMTSPEWENRFLAGGEGARDDESYVCLINPITPEKRVLRRSLLASTLSALARNLRLNESLAFFEIGPVFEPTAQALPREPGRLAIALTGLRQEPDWQNSDRIGWDFFDIKGILDELCASAHVAVKYARGSHPSFHPGKCALIQTSEGVPLGILGEMHPLALKQAEINQPVFAAEIDLDLNAAARVPNRDAQRVPADQGGSGGGGGRGYSRGTRGRSDPPGRGQAASRIAALRYFPRAAAWGRQKKPRLRINLPGARPHADGQGRRQPARAHHPPPGAGTRSEIAFVSGSADQRLDMTGSSPVLMVRSYVFQGLLKD